MKVIHVTPHYPPSIGGIEKQVYTLVSELSRLNFDVEVFTTSDGPSINGLHPPNNVPVRYLKPLDTWYRISPKLGWQLLESDADLYHAHCAGSWGGDIAPLIAKLKGVPVVSTPQLWPNRWALKHKELSKKILLLLRRSLVDRAPLSMVDHIFLSCEAEKRQLTRALRAKCSVFTNVTDARLISQKIRKKDIDIFKSKWGISEFEDIVLYVGRFSPEKGVLDLVKAFLRQDLKETALLLVGWGIGAYADNVAKYVQRNKNRKKLICTGYLIGKELYMAYASSTIFVLPSYFELRPLALVDAVGFGLPIAMSDACTSCGIVPEGGALTLAPGDVGNLSQILSMLIVDKELKTQMSFRNLKATCISWSEYAARVASVYKRLEIN